MIGVSRYLAVYDVSVNRQRSKIASILLQYGDRLQRSVFELWLDRSQLREVRRQIGPLLSSGDQLELVPIDHGPGRRRWRWGEEVATSDPVILLGE
jgi:CRISPR-associated endonuclease Cas2